VIFVGSHLKQTCVKDQSACFHARENSARAKKPTTTKVEQSERQGTEVRKQAAYLKSVALPVVPSADPTAPFGRDDNDRPIRPGRSDLQLAEDLLAKTFLKPGTCPHKSNPKYCLLCGTANYKAAPAEPIDLEDQLRSLLGITAASVAPAGSVQSKKFTFFPAILGITRGQLIGLLELTVGVEPRAVKKKVLKSRAAIEAQVAELQQISQTDR